MHTIILIDSSTDLDELRNALNHSQAHRLRVTIDSDGVKFKVNGGMWSHPMGSLDPECDAAHEMACCRSSIGPDCNHKTVPKDEDIDNNGLYRSTLTEAVPETEEPEICPCGRHYNGITCQQYESLTGYPGERVE